MISDADGGIKMINIDGVDYIPLSEYADRSGVDASGLRRKLAAGEIDGIKISRSWFVPASTPDAADGRVKSGNYRNWRKKVAQKDGS
jgi:hypothetical protein